jgi:SagB-type dehydrogenase family enzyme
MSSTGGRNRNRENRIGRKFIEMTKFEHLGVSDQMRGVRMPPLELPHEGSGDIIELPDPARIDPGRTDLRRAIEGRSSVRDYSRTPLSMDELSFTLWCTQGVKEVIPYSATLRTVPSAGARHALETYLLVNNVDGMEQGLYRFLAIEHRLARLESEAGVDERITAACLGQDMVRTSAVTFIWTAVPYRMNWRYGERGYRYLYLDAGHACQNLYLAAEAIDCGVCAIAAFLDDEMNRAIGVDGVDQFVIYIATIGKK